MHFVLLLGVRLATAGVVAGDEPPCPAGEPLLTAIYGPRGSRFFVGRGPLEGWVPASGEPGGRVDRLLHVPERDLVGWAGNLTRPVDVPRDEGHGSVAIKAEGVATGTEVTLAPRCEDGGPDMHRAVVARTDRKHGVTFTDLAPGEYWYLVEEPANGRRPLRAWRSAQGRVVLAGTVVIPETGATRLVVEPDREMGALQLSDRPNPHLVHAAEPRFACPGVPDSSPGLGPSRDTPASFPADPRSLMHGAPEIEFQTIPQAEAAMLWPGLVE